MRAILVLTFFLITSPACAVTLELVGDPIQGGLMMGKTEPGATVRYDDTDLRLSPEGDFLIGFARDAKGTHRVAATGPDGSRETRTLTVAARHFDIQRINGLPERQVTPAPDDLVRIRAEAQLMKSAREHSVDDAWFRSGFEWPTEGPISGVYGSQRILNGEARAPHYGLDIAGPAGTPIRAAASGIVAFTHPGMYFNGRTLVIDHGLGLNSIYLHMSEIDVEPGMHVEKGQVVGRIGATGRVTGAHLHWGLQLGSTYIDPQLVLPPR